MIDDFAPKKPTQGRTPDKPEQLTGFRPSSTLPPRSGDDLMPTSNEAPQPVNNNPPLPNDSTPIPAPHSSELPPNMGKSKSKKKWFLIIPLILILLGGVGYVVWYFGISDSGKPVTSTNSSQTEEVEETEVETIPVSPLSGVDVTEAEASRPVTSIMIENSGEARPQSGLFEAELVFEAIAEGGITRFLALYQASQPQYIGPIRSARPYYVEWAATFDATYIHAGGSPDGQQRIKDLGVKDMSAFSDTDVFYRTSDRFAPHNLYSSFKGIDELNKKSGFTSSTYTPWTRKDDVPQTVLANTVNIDISSDFFDVQYIYNKPSNTYLRSEGGEPHVDERTNKQLNPKVVIAMEMGYSQNGIYSVYRTTGTGNMLVFQDGVVSQGTWKRDGPTDQYVFTDKYGFPLILNKGQTWVSVVSSIGDVAHQP